MNCSHVVLQALRAGGASMDQLPAGASGMARPSFVEQAADQINQDAANPPSFVSRMLSSAGHMFGIR